MIAIKNEQELGYMRQACKITAAARALAGEMVRPGVSTRSIDKAVHDFIVAQGAKPSFLGYNGFPASTCISVNATVIHGIPGGYILKDYYAKQGKLCLVNADQSIEDANRDILKGIGGKV